MTRDGEEHSVNFGSRRIDFRLVPRAGDKFRVTVNPDFSIVVEAPESKTLEQVSGRVKSKAGWISKQIRYFEQFLPRMPAKRYLSGETFQYLGRRYRLKVIRGEKPVVKLIAPFLMVALPKSHLKDAKGSRPAVVCEACSIEFRTTACGVPREYRPQWDLVGLLSVFVE
jgi:predicted metal-dependent hydrolase